MKKILFYTANGVGLGHLRRTSLIAESIKKVEPKTDILFLTMSKNISFLIHIGYQSEKLKCLTDEILRNKNEFSKAKIYNEKKFLEIVKKYKPNVIVLDVYLFGFSFPEIILSPSFDEITKVLIFRKGDTKSFRKILKENKEIFDKFEKIILPHSLEEIKETLPQKFVITGPIFKKIDKRKLPVLRKKYIISPRDFLITVALGAGGKLEKGKCDSPNKIIDNFSAVFPCLTRAIPNLKTIVIAGPYFQKNAKFEKNLPELIKISDLVISAAGYNTCNEIIQAKTPSILVPLMRGGREQFERASYLERKGVAKVFNGDSSQQLFNLIIDCKKNLDKMKLNFKKFSDWKQGNDKTAKEILNLLE